MSKERLALHFLVIIILDKHNIRKVILEINYTTLDILAERNDPKRRTFQECKLNCTT